MKRSLSQVIPFRQNPLHSWKVGARIPVHALCHLESQWLPVLPHKTYFKCTMLHTAVPTGPRPQSAPWAEVLVHGDTSVVAEISDRWMVLLSGYLIFRFVS